MGVLLQRLGYRIHSTESEQQFACDLHGTDRKPSARLYPKTNSTYCWACHKARRPVDWVRDRRQVTLEEAISFLEEMFGLTNLPDSPDPETGEVEVVDTSFEESRLRVERLLQTFTQERSLSMDRVLWGWEKYDHVLVQLRQENLSEEVAGAVLCTLRERLLSDARGTSPSYIDG